MNSDSEKVYKLVRSGSVGCYEQKRGLISVRGTEAVRFLDGLVSNNVKSLAEGVSIYAALPNAQGRLLAVARLLRRGDVFLIETEAETREKLFNNLFRFTYAGDFFVEDVSDQYRFFSIFGTSFSPLDASPLEFTARGRTDYFVARPNAEEFINALINGGSVEIPDDVYETLRIENGIPRYGVDIDESTVVPEAGIDGLVSYNKGCYIGQEIIARIHFRGHIAKKLTGLVISVENSGSGSPDGIMQSELQSVDGKSAGRITSVTFSPIIGQRIALGLIRYDYLGADTELRAGNITCKVQDLPFV